MAYKALVRIGNFVFPTPSSYSATTSTVVDSARNAAGYVIGSVIRDDIAKIELSWRFVSAQEWANMLAKFSIKRGGKFYNHVTFFCQDTNRWETREMYVNDRTASIFRTDEEGAVLGYVDAKLNLIEV